MEAVMNACRKHGKVGVMVGVGEEMLRLCLSMGFTMIVCGGDVSFLVAGSKQAAAEARKIIGTDAAKQTGAAPKSIY
jgi:2-keto-3-deoxy-L-rhamnonate aldolase RhmA